MRSRPCGAPRSAERGWRRPRARHARPAPPGRYPWPASSLIGRKQNDFDEARRIEQQSLRAYERAHHRLEDAERALASSAKHAPHRSAASPSYASTRTQGAGSNSSKSVWPCATTSSPAPRPASVRGLVTDVLEQTPGRERLKRARLEASPAGDAATRAVLALSRHDPGYRAVPMPPLRPMEREGPSFGR